MATATHDTPTDARPLTTGQLARLAGGERWQVLALIRRGLLPDAAQRVGVFRLWAAGDVPRVRAALEAGGYSPANRNDLKPEYSE